MLDKVGKLATPDTSVDALVQASAQPTGTQAPPSTLAELNKAMQAGGERLRQSIRLGAHVHTVS